MFKFSYNSLTLDILFGEKKIERLRFCIPESFNTPIINSNSFTTK